MSVESKMGRPCNHIYGVFVWYFFLFLCFFFKAINAQLNGNWLSGHATFYGSDQNPTTLGKSLFLKTKKVANIFFQIEYEYLIIRSI